MSIKYQVFISSTFEDLKEEREQVIKALLEMGHIPVGMEMFSAADEEQWGIIARQIEEVDYYAVIVSHRYGSVTATGIGFTEKEYDYAISKGVPVLGFVIDDKAPWPADRMESDKTKRKRLEAFKSKVCGRMVNFWSNKNDLHAKFSIALMKAFTTNPRTGWTRANEIAGPEVTKELTRLSSENAALRRQIETMERKEREQDKDALRELYRILHRNEVTTYVRKKADDWGEPIQTTLLQIFQGCAAKLLVENSPEEIANDLALEISNSTEFFRKWPVPENFLRGWLADLHSLDLVEPSKKKHSVHDKNEYWCLTELGRELLKYLRRFQLELSVHATIETAPEVPSGQ